MGQGIVVRCKNCGDEKQYLQGIGFSYPAFLDTVRQDVRNGEYGKEAGEFLAEHPECAIDVGNEIYFCNKCSHLEQDVKLKMSAGNVSFQKQYPCPHCGKTLKPFRPDRAKHYEKLAHIFCGRCGDSEHIEVDFILWD